jgi:N-methylhydantoinase A
VTSADSERIRVAFDVGGTFTDVVIVAGDRLVRRKLLNDRPQREIARLIAQETMRLREDAAGASPTVVHGSTVASNSVVEGQGAVVGFITTRGFRDELELRRLARPGTYDFMWERAEAVVPRHLRAEIAERTNAAGHVELAPDVDEVEAVLDHLVHLGAEAAGICFLNSHLNPANEALVARAARARGIATTASHEIDREPGEFERSSTTAVNAGLLRVVGDYLREVQQPFEEMAVPFHLMQANGGITTPAMATRKPVCLIESGPAAGVLAASALCVDSDVSGAIAFDMGGTTVKACLIEEGRALERSEIEVGSGGNISARYSRGQGYLVRTPAFDMVELGAGGGSLVWTDQEGLLRVGPRSAAARPGPAAYGRGGQAPTVTDANVLLGYIGEGPIGEGEVVIRRDLAERAFTPLAQKLGLSLDECAFGALAVADATMTRALRAVSTERGRDPATLTLIAFGGGGPIHAARLAERIGIIRVLVPPLAGVYSAVGLQVAETRFDFAQGLASPLTLDQFDDVQADLEILEERARTELADLTAMARPEHRSQSWTFERRLDVRYVEQAGALTVVVPDVEVGVAASVAQSFEDEHERLFGYRRSGAPLEVTSVRVLAKSPERGSDLRAFRSTVTGGQLSGAPSDRSVYSGPTHGRVKAWCRVRQAMASDGSWISGPGLVTETDTTTVVPLGWAVRSHADSGCLELRRASEVL